MKLIDEIHSKASAEQIASRDHDTIAAAVNVGRARAGARIDAVMLMARLTNSEATAVFTKLREVAAQNVLVDEALQQLRTTGLDLSHANAQAMIDQLFAAPLAEKLKALGFEPDPVTAAQCAQALDGGA